MIAEDVASSTREVTEITTRIQQSVNYVVQGVMQTDSKVKESVVSIHEAQEALMVIALQQEVEKFKVRSSFESR